MATEKRTPLGMQQPLQFDFSDPKRLERLAMTMDPAAGQFLLTMPPEQFQMFGQPQQGQYMDMLSPRNENGVNLSPQYQQQLQQNFDLGSQAAAESQVPVEAFGGAGPAAGGGGINYMALLGLANAAAQQKRQGPSMPPAFAVAPSNQWKGFQAQPLQTPALRQRAGSLAQILGMR